MRAERTQQTNGQGNKRASGGLAARTTHKINFFIQRITSNVPSAAKIMKLPRVPLRTKKTATLPARIAIDNTAPSTAAA